MIINRLETAKFEAALPAKKYFIFIRLLYTVDEYRIHTTYTYHVIFRSNIVKLFVLYFSYAKVGFFQRCLISLVKTFNLDNECSNKLIVMTNFLTNLVGTQKLSFDLTSFQVQLFVPEFKEEFSLPNFASFQTTFELQQSRDVEIGRGKFLSLAGIKKSVLKPFRIFPPIPPIQ